MSTTSRWLLLASLAWAAALAGAQPANHPVPPQAGRGGPGEEYPPRAQNVPTEGFWPTQLMIERAIDRITEDMSRRYNFDEDQLYSTRQVFKERLPGWLNQNRAEIQTLMNQYFETLLSDRAPDPLMVADWSQRVLPLLGEFGDVVHEVGNDMREFMTEDQQVVLEGELAAFDTGLRLATNKLGVWSQGGYDPETEWIRPGPDRRRIDRERRAELEYQMETARREAIGRAAGTDVAAPAHPPAADAGARPEQFAPQPSGASKTSEDEWTRYVEDFIRKYDLNDEQQSSARKFLDAKKQQRDRYLSRKADEMERIHKLYKEAKTKDELDRAEGEYKKLNAPIETMFKSLKEKLDTLPTRKQRRDAETPEEPSPQPASPDRTEQKPPPKPSPPSP